MNDSKKHFWLYVLKLEQGKFYIGITSKTPEVRFKEHQSGFMSARWTRKYKPLKIIDRKDLGNKTLKEAEEYENKVVRKYMKQKGYNNARGGDLTDEQDYVRRFGLFFDAWSYESLTTVILLTLMLVIMLIAYYLK